MGTKKYFVTLMWSMDSMFNTIKNGKTAKLPQKYST